MRLPITRAGVPRKLKLPHQTAPDATRPEHGVRPRRGTTVSIEWGTTPTNCPEISERGLGDPCIAAAECDLIINDSDLCKIYAASLHRPFDEEQRDSKGERTGSRELAAMCSK